MWRGSLGLAYLFPALSSAGASLAGPCSVSTSTGWPEAVAHPRLPQNVACGFAALRSSEIGYSTAIACSSLYGRYSFGRCS